MEDVAQNIASTDAALEAALLTLQTTGQQISPLVSTLCQAIEAVHASTSPMPSPALLLKSLQALGIALNDILGPGYAGSETERDTWLLPVASSLLKALGHCYFSEQWHRALLAADASPQKDTFPAVQAAARELLKDQVFGLLIQAGSGLKDGDEWPPALTACYTTVLHLGEYNFVREAILHSCTHSPAAFPHTICRMTLQQSNQFSLAVILQRTRLRSSSAGATSVLRPHAARTITPRSTCCGWAW
jgi:hypothetical protein